ncbi:MAG: hypothetical protein WBN40_09395 [Pseudomonadales bacterium]
MKGQRRLYRLLSLLFLAVLFAACSCNQAQRTAHLEAGYRFQPAEVLAAGVINIRQPVDGIYSAGQPTPEQLEQLARAGIKHIVSLRPAAELDWDEASYVRSLGMSYHSIPVRGAQDLSGVNASKLTGLLEQFEDEPALLHCGSGNRVGALSAIAARQRGLSSQEAVAEGRRWGMTQLEEAVREKFEISSP